MKAENRWLHRRQAERSTTGRPAYWPGPRSNRASGRGSSLLPFGRHHVLFSALHRNPWSKFV